MKLKLASLLTSSNKISPTVQGSKLTLEGSVAIKTPLSGISAGKGGLQEEDSIIMQESFSPLLRKTCTAYTDLTRPSAAWDF